MQGCPRSEAEVRFIKFIIVTLNLHALQQCMGPDMQFTPVVVSCMTGSYGLFYKNRPDFDLLYHCVVNIYCLYYIGNNNSKLTIFIDYMLFWARGT